MDEARIAAKPVGLPRPIAPDPHKHLRPVPWSQADLEWGVLDEEAVSERKGACLVCGEVVETGSVFLSLGVMPGDVLKRRRMVRSRELGRVYIADGGPLHDRCVKITLAHCAEMRKRLASGSTRICRYRV